MAEDTKCKKFPIVQTFFVGGAGNEVTGSSTILRIVTSDGKSVNLMVDAGAAQGEIEYRNYSYPVHGDKIDAVILTHAHYDHVGNLPLLCRSGYRGPIYSTGVTKKLVYPLLVDAAVIQEKKAKGFEKRYTRVNDSKEKEAASQVWLDILDGSNEALFTQDDVEQAKEQFKTLRVNELHEIFPGIEIRLLPTSHQFGAVRVEIHVKDPNGSTYGIVFSGDVGPTDSLLYNPKSKYENEDIDCLILESLHGTEEPLETLDESIKNLFSIIRKASRQKKHVVLAGFSLDRNAMLVYLMNLLKKKHLPISVVIDSPLTMCELDIYQSGYQKDSDYFQELGNNPFDTDNFKIINYYREHVDSVLRGEAPRVIITASATGSGGRIVDYFTNCLNRTDYVFVFCGWVSPDSPSAIIHDTEYGKKVEANDCTYIKRCTTYRLHGFTSHGYYKEMATVVRDYPNIKALILNHANFDDKVNVARRISNTIYGDYEAILIPEVYSGYELSPESTHTIDYDEVLCAFEGIIDSEKVNAEYDRQMEEILSIFE